MAIANRGEIAVRLISTCKEMGIKPVLLYSSADENSLACRLSSDKVCIGPGPAEQSYLNISAVIEGALSGGADALHPGYGFLSEKPELAKACRDNNLIFIGPSASSLKIFGNKVSARKHAEKCGLPVLPAFYVDTEDSEFLLKLVSKMGFPVMIKSVQGGGGRGLRVVHSKKEWSEALASAQRETQSAFGSSEVFVEKYLPSAQHIEVQIFVDPLKRVFYLFDRDCSVQRKNQKIIEEAPARIPQQVRKEIGSAAEALFQSVDYLQAGTAEFLYQDGQFYFMEVNPRIQVECPVTEMILGIDLIRAQILTAQGLSPFVQKEFTPRGHSIQCRIYAEDMEKQFPVSGPLASCSFPQGVNCRFDVGYESKDVVPEFYDSMLGKVIVWEENRTRAVAKMKHALSETVVFGLKTNLGFLQDVLSHQVFIKGEVDTNFIEQVFLKSWKEETTEFLDPEVISALRAEFALLGGVGTEHRVSSLREETLNNPWTDFYNKR